MNAFLSIVGNDFAQNHPPIVRHSYNWLAALTAIIISLYTLFFFKVSLVKVKAFNGFFFFTSFPFPFNIMLFFFFFFFLLITMVHAIIKRFTDFSCFFARFSPSPSRRVLYLFPLPLARRHTRKHSRSFSRFSAYHSLPNSHR